MTNKYEALRELLSKATPGDWIIKKHGVIAAGPVQHYTNGSTQDQIIMTTGAVWMSSDEQCANAELIAAAHNALPGLLDEVDRQKAVDEARGRLIRNQGAELTRMTDHIDAQAAEIAKLRNPWQPIETAPKDATRVILAWGGTAINGFYLDNSGTSHPWQGWCTESMVPSPPGKPTHWIPMPAPPAALSGESNDRS